MSKIILLALIALLSGCSGVPYIDKTYTASSQDSRVQFLVLHYTAGDFPGSLKILTQGPVSSHYLLSADAAPTIYLLVDENRRAYHAGVSEWLGSTALNASSIGIEIVNRGFQETPEGRAWVPYPKEQIDTLLPLVKDIVKRHQIKPTHVIGHSDIAPQRKTDPGPLFPWKRLADEGLILWPEEMAVATQRTLFDAALPDIRWFQDLLASVGYRVQRHALLDDETRNVIAAFQSKYRPARFDGEPDAETAALLAVLVSQMARASVPVSFAKPIAYPADVPAASSPRATPEPALPSPAQTN